MKVFILWLMSLFLVQSHDMTIPVAVSVATVMHTYKQAAPEVVDECCCQCVGGIITHGDGHKTACPCPPTCKCKRAVTHPPAVLHTQCKDGKCTPKR